MSVKQPESSTSPGREDLAPDADDLISLWVLRILVRLNMFNRFSDAMGGFHNEELLREIGLGDFYGTTDSDRDTIFAALSKRLHELEAAPLQRDEDAFSRNIALLEEALSLSRIDMEILRFAAMCTSSGSFAHVMDMLGEMSNEQMKRALSVILNCSIPEIEDALHANGTLLSSGLMRVETGGAYLYPLRGRLDVPHGIRYALTQEHSDATAALQCFFRKSVKARLGVDDFPHVHTDVALLHDYLFSVVQQKTSGVNILIYGMSGTGKTELVRTLVSACGLRLYEITMRDMNGDPIEGADRFSALQLSQKLLAREQRCAIMFDEIEDVFPQMDYPLFGPARTSQLKKAWVNNMLEENPVPTFWVSNAAHHIEASFLRRFDYTLKLRPPTRAVRRRILEKYLGDLPVREAWLSRMAEHEQLTPGDIERAAKVASHVDYQDAEEVEKILERIIGNTLEIMGLPRKPYTPVTHLTRYSLDFLNPDRDLVQLTAGLKGHPNARLCLYGAAGTGKTAFGHYIASQLDKALLVKRASDILSKWVGEAERNIAAMFQEAESENMVLLLDEADSFLQDRAHAHHSWEVTQVNELLVQMEMFEGLFIAATNLMDSLDAASLRRFDFKIKFDFMTLQQAWELFEQVLQEHSQVCENTTSAKKELARLHNVTPGDFATVVRQARSLGQTLTADILLQSLEQECSAKPGSSRAIGFM